ncbi:MAG: hypothetical protein H6623_03145 [Bdellovibrionaceae bacterium]|nr:hypothetical protein [Pseudobdellovibrionaceae bacterium]
MSNQSGQAVLEYILVLVIVVGIILSTMYQLNTAFKKYVQSYFGEYIACLLETGELPSLGSGEGANKEICSSAYEPFSLKNGRPLAGGGSDKGGKKGSKTPLYKGSGPNKYSSSRNNNLNNSGVTRNMSALNGESVSGSGKENKDESSKKAFRKSAKADADITFRRRQFRQQHKIPVSGYFKMQDDKGQKDTPPRKVTATGKHSRADGQARKIAVDMNKFRTLASDDSGLGMNLSLSDYMRYLLIGGLIIMIVIFFGGQIMQLTKNWEGGE